MDEAVRLLTSLLLLINMPEVHRADYYNVAMYDIPVVSAEVKR